MPRKKLQAPETARDRRKRIIAEILQMPVTDQEVLLEVLTVLHERAVAELGDDPIGETRSGSYDLPPSKAKAIKDPLRAVPAGAVVGAGVAPRKRRPRGFAAGVAGGAAVSNDPISQVGLDADLGDVD